MRVRSASAACSAPSGSLVSGMTSDRAGAGGAADGAAGGAGGGDGGGVAPGAGAGAGAAARNAVRSSRALARSARSRGRGAQATSALPAASPAEDASRSSRTAIPPGASVRCAEADIPFRSGRLRPASGDSAAVSATAAAMAKSNPASCAGWATMPRTVSCAPADRASRSIGYGRSGNSDGAPRLALNVKSAPLRLPLTAALIG